MIMYNMWQINESESESESESLPHTLTEPSHSLTP